MDRKRIIIIGAGTLASAGLLVGGTVAAANAFGLHDQHGVKTSIPGVGTRHDGSDDPATHDLGDDDGVHATPTPSTTPSDDPTAVPGTVVPDKHGDPTKNDDPVAVVPGAPVEVHHGGEAGDDNGGQRGSGSDSSGSGSSSGGSDDGGRHGGGSGGRSGDDGSGHH